MKARQGTERTWHFAHAKASDCAGAYEKSVHEAAKQMLRDRKQLRLPALSVTVQAYDAFHRLQQESETLFEAKHITFDTCKTGQVIADVSPDLVGTLRDRQLLIELTVFHRLMPEKADRLKKTGLAVLELDLSQFKTEQATRERLEAALFAREDNRHWVCHPAVSAAEERLQESLRQRLATVEAEWSEQKKKAQTERAAHQERLKAFRRLPGPHHSPVSLGLTWRAGFPAEGIWAPAREAFCQRHGLSTTHVQEVFGTVTRRSDLARTTPDQLAKEWGHKLRVGPDAILRYFAEAGYTIK